MQNIVSLKKHPIAAAVSMLLLQCCIARAAEPPVPASSPAEPATSESIGPQTVEEVGSPAPEVAPPAEKLEEVVVTAVARRTNRLDTSVSTSSINPDEAFQAAPRSTEELFRSLPGIRSESSGGEANANITIRGIPLATGGSKYLQLWEDGLPVLEYGDINFANADNFLRLDGSVARVESIRGGSASTFASDSPGGVINFISKTGESEGGSIGESFGLDYTDYRTDFSYGGKLSDSINYHIGGFYRTGEGIRHTGFNGQNGGQIKANITKHLDGGYLRFYVKHLDDRVSTYLPSPMLVKGGGSFGAAPGYDARHDSLYSQYQTQIVTYDAFGNRRSRDLTDGVHALVNAFGFEFDKELAGWHVNNKFRNSTISGGFISPFTAGVGDAQTLSDGICGCTGATVVAGQGPNRGTPYNGLAFQNLLFDTSFKDVGLLVDDLKISRDLGPISATAGFYFARQKIAIDWNSWQFLLQTLGRDPVGLSVTRPDGVAVSNNNGLYNPGLLSWSWNLNYDTTAPYLNLGGAIGKFSWDVSGRFDQVKARGTLSQSAGGQPIDYNGDGTISPGFETTGAAFVTGIDPSGRVNYGAQHFEYSIGGNYRLTPKSSAFVRYSDGARFDADRLLQIANAVNPDGSLGAGTKGYDEVRQLEGGYKLQGPGFAFYPTAFYTVTDEANADITTGETFLRRYSAYGVELEGRYRVLNTGFNITGNVTYTHARIDSDRVNPAVVGNTPRRQADFIWTVTPQYEAQRWRVGVTLQGSSAYFLNDDNRRENALKQGAYTILNAFGSVDLIRGLTFSLSVNNLTDAFVVTEAEEATGAPGSLVRARPLSGRSILGAFKYDF